MHVVLLRFSTNKTAAPDHLTAHQEWVTKGIEDGSFVVVGSIRPGLGGAIVSAGRSTEELQALVDQDSFVVHDVVGAEIVEIEPHHVDPRLALLGG